MLLAAVQIRSLTPLLIAAGVGVLTILLLLRRRQSLPRFTLACLIIAIGLLVAAAGDLLVSLPRTEKIVVMVDLSPSTRSAVYRDRRSLDQRLRELLGGRTFRTIAFGQANEALPAGDRLADAAATRTVFDPPADADGIVLLSDGQFELPASGPPTFPVIDGGLIDPTDAAVRDATVDSTAAPIPIAGVNGALPTRTARVTIAGRSGDRLLSIDAGPATLVSAKGGGISPPLPIEPSHAVHRVELNAGDAWPENDALQFTDAAPRPIVKWWVAGEGRFPYGWRVTPTDWLPADPAEYLSPAVIALNNLSADQISPAAMEHLHQYVRDLGGTLLIIGGKDAFGSGGYTGTTLDDLSPLASDPPTPATQWLLLTDASGSMAGAASMSGATSASGAGTAGSMGGGNSGVSAPGTSGATAGGGTNDARAVGVAGAGGNGVGSSFSGGATRWSAATAALTSILRDLPPADEVSVGSFAGEVKWWSTGASVRDTRGKSLPPADVAPSGPTNLQAALDGLLKQPAGARPTNLIILTDGEATLDHADAIAAAMKDRQTHLHVLAIGAGTALGALKSIAIATGGSFLTELDAAKWTAAVRSIVRAARPDRMIAGPLDARFSGELAVLPAAPVSNANRTWLKSSATLLASGSPVGDAFVATQPLDAPVPLAARQSVGTGQVISLAFFPNGSELLAIESLVAGPPRDPRYRFDWSLAARGKVRLDASDGDRFINDLAPRLVLTSLQGAAVDQLFEQTAPGRYEATFPAALEPRLAKVMLDGHEVDRHAIAGRYAAEFESIGLDRDALQELARRTGGRVIDPDVKTPIALPRQWRETALSPWLAVAAAGLIGAGLVVWRRR